MLSPTLRPCILDHADQLVAAVDRPAGEVWASELIPLLESLRFLEEEGPALLAPRRARGKTGLAFKGLETLIRRQPVGRVLIIGPFNYPLFLPGSQCLQALAAGNRVTWKPGRGGAPVAQAMREILVETGLPPDRLEVTDETPEAGLSAIESGVDLVIFTGSAKVAKRIAALAAEHLTPCLLEASGSDACFVLEGADLDRVAKAIHFGLTLNSGQTCISPRRVFVPVALADELEARLTSLLRDCPAVNLPGPVHDEALRLIEDACERGAKHISPAKAETNSLHPGILAPLDPDSELCRADLFAPLAGIIPYSSIDRALELDRQCPYALGASVFGPQDQACELAARLGAGCVTINDLVAPTADPRAPFGGNRQSGYGRTRGASGLLACTREQSIIVRRGRFLPHLQKDAMSRVGLFRALARLSHGRGFSQKFRAMLDLARSGRG